MYTSIFIFLNELHICLKLNFNLTSTCRKFSINRNDIISRIRKSDQREETNKRTRLNTEQARTQGTASYTCI